jgi:glycosyltransferase involved in cell wall biosynthesis
MSKVSVIIPIYNAEAFIKTTLESVFKQTHSNLEVICIDDGSTDQTAKIIQTLAKQDPRLIYHKQPKNMGRPSFGRNTGLKIAKGDFITFLDHDDTFLPDKLAVSLKFMQEKKVDFMCSNIYLFNNEKQKIDGKAWESVGGEVRQNFAHRLLKGNFVPPNSTLIRRQVLDKVKEFDTNLKAADDFDFWYRIARQFPCDVYPEPLATWRYQNQESISANQLLMLQDEQQFYQKILQTPEADGLKWSESEKNEAQIGFNRNLKRIANQYLLKSDYQTARDIYEQIGYKPVASAVNLAGPFIKNAYRLKRKIKNKKIFSPLDLQF